MPPVGYGIWGRPTATIDWCEENYVVTPWIAEFWNTISNWIMIIPPSLAALISWKRKMELRIIMSYLSIGLVGLGSFAFHCTLLYNMQLLDELPMIYGTFILLYGMLQINSKENVMNLQLVIFFSILSFAITVIYLVVINPIFFMASYGVLAIWLFGLTVHNYKKLQGSASLVTLAVASYFLGFVLWNIDNNFCPQMRYVRGSLPMLAKPITQLHAWWHILAGAGTYISILFSSHLRLKCLGYQSSLKVYYRFLPVIEKQNGQIKHEKEKVINNNFKLQPRDGNISK